MVLGWLAALFAVMASVVALTAVVVGWPVLLLALPLAGVAALFWYHATGRLTAKLREQARREPGRGAPAGRRRRRAAGSAGTGPRRNGARWAGQRRDRRRRGEPWDADQRGRRGSSPPTDAGMPRDRARRILGVGPDADADAVRAAYRRKVKETHPDRGGSSDAFQRVTEAYEALEEPAGGAV